MIKNPPADAGDVGLTPGSGKSPGEANGNPLQSSCLGNPMDRGAWWATVDRVTKSRTGHGLVTEYICTYSVIGYLDWTLLIQLTIINIYKNLSNLRRKYSPTR